MEAGQSDEEVLEAVYAKYGSETRVQPPDDGFGLIGWIAPFATLLAGLALVPWGHPEVAQVEPRSIAGHRRSRRSR